MTEDLDSKELHPDGGGKGNLNRSKDRKTRNKPLTKIVVRRLPPTMTEEAFLEQVSPIPEHDYFYFARPDPTLGPCGFARAYINFVNIEDIYLFKDKFDGYVFVDVKGVEYVGIVEYSPFQRVPKRRKKKDPKCGTIESDPIYQDFLESLKEPENESREPKLEYSYQVNDKNDKKENSSTPLLEYLAARRQDKKVREERRRRENDKRKLRIERKPKEASIKEEDDGDDVKVKVKENEKEKVSKKKDDDIEANDFKVSKDQRKANSFAERKKKGDGDKKDVKDSHSEDHYKKDKRDKFKESAKDQKTKKYSDIRKERLKHTEQKKDETRKSVATEKHNDKNEKFVEKSEKRTPKINPDDIKPFTQLPQIKTDDLVKVIEEMDRKMKLGDSKSSDIVSKTEENVTKKKEDKFSKKKDEWTEIDVKPQKIKDELSKAKERPRRNSLDSNTGSTKREDDIELKRQKSMSEREKSTDTEDSLDKDKGDSASDKRRTRNKDRPSLVIYQPGMGKFSKQRISRDKDTNEKPVPELEKKDT